MAKNEVVGWGWAGAQYGKNLFISHRLSVNDAEDILDAQQGKCPGCMVALAYPFRKELKTGVKPQISKVKRYEANGEQLPVSREDTRGMVCRECARNQAVIAKIVWPWKANG